MTTYAYNGTDPRSDGETATCYGARGTIAGYGRHVRANERPCDRCRDAMNAYNRERRKKWENVPSTRDADRRRRRAKARAWAALAKRHPDEYAALLRIELGRALSESLTTASTKENP